MMILASHDFPHVCNLLLLPFTFVLTLLLLASHTSVSNVHASLLSAAFWPLSAIT